MAENRYGGKLREGNQDILSLCPANQVLRLELALQLQEELNTTKRIRRLKDDFSVIEVGVGEGDLTKYLLDYNPEIIINALDESEAMIVSARKTLEKDLHRVKFIEEDAVSHLYNLFVSGEPKYDTIISAWTIHNFMWPAKMKFFTYAYYSLNQGGSMLLMDKVYPDNMSNWDVLRHTQMERYRRFLKPELYDSIRKHEQQDFQDQYRMVEGETVDILKKIGFGVEVLDRIEREVLLVARK